MKVQLLKIDGQRQFQILLEPELMLEVLRLMSVGVMEQTPENSTEALEVIAEAGVDESLYPPHVKAMVQAVQAKCKSGPLFFHSCRLLNSMITEDLKRSS